MNDLFLRQLNSVDFTDWMGSDVIRYLMESKIESKVQATSKLSFENRHLLNLEIVINTILYKLSFIARQYYCIWYNCVCAF